MGWEVPESEILGSLAEIKEGSSVLGDEADAFSGVDFPLAEVAELGLDHHMINIYQLNNQKNKNPSPPSHPPLPLLLSYSLPEKHLLILFFLSSFLTLADRLVY